MTDKTPLSLEDIGLFLQANPEWLYMEGGITRDFLFKDFKEAFSFLQKVAEHAEEIQHHPEIWNIYNKVSLRLTTHDADDQITALDIELAQKISKLISE